MKWQNTTNGEKISVCQRQKGGGYDYKEVTKESLCDEEIVLYLDHGSGYTTLYRGFNCIELHAYISTHKHTHNWVAHTNSWKQYSL